MAGRPRKQKVTAAVSLEECVVKVWLKGTRRVSRTIAFRGDQTLDDVHRAIFDAFDRCDPHLYAFYFPKLILKRRATPGMVKQFAPPEMVEDQGPVGIEWSSGLNGIATRCAWPQSRQDLRVPL